MQEADVSGNKTRKKRLTIILSAIFAFAIIMGPGPGLYLINPDPADVHAVVALGSVPVLYLWALFWFAVQAAVVLTAYFKLWGAGVEDGRDSGERT